MGEVYMWSRGLAGEAVTELANDALNHYQQLGHFHAASEKYSHFSLGDILSSNATTP